MRITPQSPEALPDIISTLRDGGVVAHPTETCYGFACDMTNRSAVEKLFAIKKRSHDQSVSGLFASIEHAKEWAMFSEHAIAIAQDHFPGPLTLVLPLKNVDEQYCVTPLARQSLGVVWSADEGQRISAPVLYPMLLPDPKWLGIRISSHPFAQCIAESYDYPVSTTSANIHGLPSPYSAQEIVDQFADQDLQPDLIIDGGVLTRANTSTVAQLHGDALTVLRQGDIVLS